MKIGLLKKEEKNEWGWRQKVQGTFLGNTQFRSYIYLDGGCDCNVIIFQSEPRSTSLPIYHRRLN
jgi:hypothetical protein